MSQIEQKPIHTFFVNQSVKIFNQQINEIESQVLSNLKINENSIEDLLILSQINHKYHLNYKESLKIIQGILIKNPNYLDARLDLIEILIDFRFTSHQQCLMMINECLNIDNNYWRTYFFKIRILDNIGEKEVSTKKEIEKCLQNFPDNIWLQIFHAQTLSENEETYQESLKVLTKVREYESLDYDLLRRISYALGNIKQGEEALKYIERSIQLNPKSFNSYNEYAYLERTINQDDDKCIEYCLKSISLNPRYSFTIFNLYTTYKKKNNDQESLKWLKYAQEINNTPFIYHQLIYDYYDNKKLELAKYYSHKNIQKFNFDPYSNLLNQKLQRQEFSYTIKDYEQYELQSIKCLNIDSLNSTEQDYQEVTETLNQVFE